ncbi:cell division topological specificity factor MinE [Xylophilus sp. ASV27]|uniref:cell division topological specificity factor MinE n=1 Tax=Xylophilus sp. ASV27 TaxID=2795129 RepID=UPI0018EAC41D|nr:cell division topological specificity factor MinE [Xylophilus sp. ASV27]
MSFLSFLLGEKKKTASVAKERLQIILAHERSGSSKKPSYLPDLQRELIAVISKYVSISPGDIKVNLEHQDNFDVLEVKIELPDAAKPAIASP